MLELIVVIGIIASILAIRWLVEIDFSGSILTLLGLNLFAVGVLEGIPTGLYYHILLYQVLGRRGELPAGWWISPSRYHARLTGSEKQRVLRWFYLGGVGFLLCITGGTLALLGLLLGTNFSLFFEP